MRALLLFAIIMFPQIAFGQDTASSNQEAYYQQLVTILTNVILRLSFLVSIIVLLITGVLYALKTFDENAISKRDLKPMTFLKFIAGIALASLLFAPLNSMKLFNDLTGLHIEGDERMSICSVVEIDVAHFEWENNANACINKVEDRFEELAKYKNEDRLSTFNFGLMFGVIQLIALGFMLNSGVTLAKHIWGFRQVKTSVGGAFIAMTMASAVFASPNIVAYIQDLRGGNQSPVNTGVE